MVTSEHKALGTAAALCVAAALYLYKVRQLQHARTAADTTADDHKATKRSWRQEHSKHVAGSSCACCSNSNASIDSTAATTTATQAAVNDAQPDVARERAGSSSSSEGEGWLLGIDDDAFDDDTPALVTPALSNGCSCIHEKLLVRICALHTSCKSCVLNSLVAAPNSNDHSTTLLARTTCCK
jgi:hypothetical protein